MTPIMFWIIMLGSMSLGGLAGVLTRPKLSGTPIPLEILLTSPSADNPVRDALASHLAMTIGIGAIFAMLGLFLFTYLGNRRINRL